MGDAVGDAMGPRGRAFATLTACLTGVWHAAPPAPPHPVDGRTCRWPDRRRPPPPAPAGKTLLARAVANRTDACFIRVIGSELVRKYVGEGARMVS